MKLTDNHLVLLSAAAQRADRLLVRDEAITDKAARTLLTKLVGGGVAEMVPVSRRQPCWINEDGQPQGLRITAAGLVAIGIEDEPLEQPADDLGDAAEDAAAGVDAPAAEPGARSGTKQAMIVALLRREQGATLADLIAATGWLPHTTRAALTSLRKKGHRLEKARDGQGSTTYRITADAESAGTASQAAREKAA